MHHNLVHLWLAQYVELKGPNLKGTKTDGFSQFEKHPILRLKK
jgi:hypothetical protein